ncbi:cytochrome o ubiquinol oxidase subunit IV [Thioclava sp. SK-1]|uniref:cytochrome o ubiquinol oxidase subunit IV n=1 Tax=Thioclava sp. SK-1 TaxID=1889770 RepID=UPI0008271E6B|nr:cytochrome o ubiquinol oxidase subunit IV [Thioclava sp. SK-1]OCX65969.1 cytochrome o ubiquinol oxidase subunit IV [Thioclava sp. SK-1]
MSAHAENSHGTMSQLMIGFVFAVVLTVIPFWLVMAEVDMNPVTLVGIIVGLGAVQIIVHLVYFLHVTRESENGWTFAATAFAVVILVIVLAGSLWVMHNMNANMMPMPDMGNMSEVQGITGAQDAMDAMNHGTADH